MNPEFKKRQEQVLEILSLLSKEAEKQKQLLVFIGGSAVQAILPEPMRLSIDLDAHYSGEPEKLLDCLKPDFAVSERVSKNQLQFRFFEATKKGVLVKIDLTRFGLPGKGKAFELTKISSFKARVATPSYLLAGKLSALAIGTVGRKEGKKDRQTDFLKDVTDSYQLISFTKLDEQVAPFFEEIVKTQNGLRKTSYPATEAVESILKTVLESIKTDDTGLVSKGSLQNFNQYLFGKTIRKPDYWEMAAKAAAFAKIVLSEKRDLKEFKKIDSTVQADYADKQKAKQWQEKLETKTIAPKLLHELKILAPKALGYYYFATFPKE